MFTLSSTWLIALSALIAPLAVALTYWWQGHRYNSRVQHAEDELRSSQQQQHVEHARWQERQASLQQQQQQSQQQVQQLQQRLDDEQQQKQHLQTELATRNEALHQQERHHAEKITLLETNKQQLLKEFEQLSSAVLEQKTQQIQAQNKQFSEHSKQGLDALLTPFKDQLEGLRKKVEDVYISDSKDRASLHAQINELHKLNQQMSQEAQSLTTALRGEKKVQGNWGEMVLESVLERSGLRLGIEFEREQSHQDDSGQRYRPDVILNLPDNKHIVVDAKVSLNAYTDYINASDERERDAAAKRHSDAIRQHIRSLADKAYQHLTGLNSPDFVFMFMPVEPAFMLAFQRDEQLFNDAFERKIVVVTPTTLLATLRTVASIWAIERRNRSTEKLAEQAAKVYDKLVLVVEKFDKVGTQLNTVHKSYDDAWNSLKTGRGNLISQVDHFVKLGVRTKKELNRQLLEEALEQDGQYDALETLDDHG